MPDATFLLGSVTKPFTAMAMMMLVERGQLKYEDRLAKFFPQFPAYAQQIKIGVCFVLWMRVLIEKRCDVV